MSTIIHTKQTIKMKPLDVRDDSFAEYNEESNEKDPKFKIGDHVISDLNGEEIVGSFYEKELQKTNQKEFRLEKVIKVYMSNGKDIIILLIAGLIKKIL